MKKKLPIYNATISNENEGIFAVSLVEYPAVEVPFMAFSDESKILEFKSLDEEKHCLTGVIMLADTPIYRRRDNFEYYINYTPETIQVMAQKMLSDYTFNNIDLQHNGEYLERGAVELTELYIKDEFKTSPFDVPNGSLIATYKVNDDDLWEECKNGSALNGFSLAGYFSDEIIDNKYTKQKQMDKNIVKTLMSELLKFGSLETDKGTVYFMEDELTEGTKVFDESGAMLDDGLYTVSEEFSFDVAEGTVTKLNKKEEEKPAEEQPEEPEQQEEAPKDEEPETEQPKDDVEDLKKQLEEKDAKIKELEDKIAELEGKNTEMSSQVDNLQTKLDEYSVIEESLEEKKETETTELKKEFRWSDAFRKN